MKTIKMLSFKLLAIPVLLLSQSVFAQFEKQIHMAWGIDEVESLNLQHKYGNVNFVDTRDDSVVVDIMIQFENVSDKKGEYLSEQLEFDVSLQGGKLNVETIYGDKFSNVKEFNVDYIINIPIDRALNVYNKYGNIRLGDLNANGRFEIKYGDIIGNHLVANDFPISLEISYAKASFDSINELDGDIAYSQLTIDGCEKADLDTKYSKLTFDELVELKIDSKYDAYNIDELGTVTGESKYTNWNIDELSNSFILKSEYGDIEVNEVAAGFDKIMVINAYGKLNFGIDEAASYFLKGETKYCSINYPDFEPIKRIKDNFYTYLEVNIGNDNTESRVEITSKYGDVDLMK